MRIKLLIFISFFHLQLSAQSISKELIGVAGNSITNENASISFSVGESVVGLMTSEDYTVQLGNGYYPSLDLEALDINTPEIIMNVRVFPNPAQDYVSISYPQESVFEVSVLDLNGKLVHKGVYVNNEPISFRSFSPGSYVIWVINKQTKQRNSYKIIKR